MTSFMVEQRTVEKKMEPLLASVQTRELELHQNQNKQNSIKESCLCRDKGRNYQSYYKLM